MLFSCYVMFIMKVQFTITRYDTTKKNNIDTKLYAALLGVYPFTKSSLRAANAIKGEATIARTLKEPRIPKTGSGTYPLNPKATNAVGNRKTMKIIIFLCIVSIVNLLTR